MPKYLGFSPREAASRLRAEARRAVNEALDLATDPHSSTYAALTAPKKPKDKPKTPRAPRFKTLPNPAAAAARLELAIIEQIAAWTDAAWVRAIAYSKDREGESNYVCASHIFNRLCRGFSPRVRWHSAPTGRPTNDRLLIAFRAREIEFNRTHPAVMKQAARIIVEVEHTRHGFRLKD
jgi:hypothetical protein